MKKLYFAFATVLFTSFLGFGQTEIKLWDAATQSATGNLLNGDTFSYAVGNDGLHGLDINIKNTSGVQKIWKVERYRIVNEAAWEDNLCWGAPGDPFGQCYTATQMSTNPWTTPSNYSLTIEDGASGNLVVDTKTVGTGTEHYRFYVIEGQSTRVDSVDVIVTCTLGISNNQKEEVSVSVYPNPVSNTLTVNTTGIDGSYDIKMVDVLGKVVFEDSGISTKKIDVSDFKNGVYLVSIFDKEKQILTKRIVVKH